MSRDEGPPYCTPYRRRLSADERNVLARVVTSWHPQLLPAVAGLHVVARCGCGCCPSILFADCAHGEPIIGGEFEHSPRFEGVDPAGNRVGVQVWVRGSRVAELRLGYIDGDVCGYQCPAPDTLKPVREMAQAREDVKRVLAGMGYDMATLGYALRKLPFEEQVKVMEAADAVMKKHGASWHELGTPSDVASH